MEEIMNHFPEFIREKIQVCKEQEQKLIFEDRKDEANLFKVRANIYEIFGTLFQVACKQEAKNGWAAVCKNFEEKAENIPKNWKASYEKAKEHNDAEKLLIEEEKLAAARTVMDYYSGLKEETV